MKIIMYIINVPGAKCQKSKCLGGEVLVANAGGVPRNHPYVGVPLVRFDPHRNLEADRTQEYT